MVKLKWKFEFLLEGKSVFLFSGASRNSDDIGVFENKMELYHSIDALRRAQANHITLFEPYCSCARSDRITRRNSVGFWVHYKILMSLGVDQIITYQLHSDKSKTIVDPTKCAIDDIPISNILMEYIAQKFVGSIANLHDHVQKNWIFCSVDAGSESLAKVFANNFGCPLMIAHKHRDYSRVNTVGSIDILTDTPIENRTVWIVDDMIDTAGSIEALVHELKKRNLATINIATAHAVLSSNAAERLRVLYNNKLLQDLVVTDTIYCDQNLQKQLPFMHLVPSTRLSAEVIMNMEAQRSTSAMFENFDVEKHLRTFQMRIQ